MGEIMYELGIAGFGAEQHVTIILADRDENSTVVHHFPAGASAMDALKLLGAFNAAYEHGHSEGIKYCSATHERPRSAWYADHVGGEAHLKSEHPRFIRQPDAGFEESK